MDAEESRARRPRPRIESFSDLIFGLALSVGAFSLVSSPPATADALYADIATFGFNFLVLISVWMKYTRIMSVLPLENRRTTLLNSLLLFAVSMEPFLFNILRSGNTQTPAAAELLNAATALYGVDIGAMLCMMGVFTVTLADEERKLVPEDMLHELRLEAVLSFVGGGIFLVSALPVFGYAFLAGNSARIDLWLAAVVIFWARRTAVRLGRIRKTEG